jgi:hypothetical protein
MATKTLSFTTAPKRSRKPEQTPSNKQPSARTVTVTRRPAVSPKSDETVSTATKNYANVKNYVLEKNKELYKRLA